MQNNGNICATVEGIFKFWSKQKIIVFLILKMIRNYDIFRNLKNPLHDNADIALVQHTVRDELNRT